MLGRSKPVQGCILDHHRWDVGLVKVWRVRWSKPMPGPQGRVMVSHLCKQVADLKAVAVHMAIEKWEVCKLCRRRWVVAG